MVVWKIQKIRIRALANFNQPAAVLFSIGLELIINSSIILVREPFRLVLGRDTSLHDPTSSPLRKRVAITAAWMVNLICNPSIIENQSKIFISSCSTSPIPLESQNQRILFLHFGFISIFCNLFFCSTFGWLTTLSQGGPLRFCYDCHSLVPVHVLCSGDLPRGPISTL